MFDVTEAADELDESTLNNHLSDEEIETAVYKEDTTGAYTDELDDVETVDVDLVRRHLRIVEAAMRQHWDETVQHLGEIPDGSTDDYVIFRCDVRRTFSRPIFEHDLDEEADHDVLVDLYVKIVDKLSEPDDAWNDMILVLPEDVNLEDAEEVANL